MRYLFLMDETECQNESTLEKLRALRSSDEVVVLSLGTLASLALRKTGIPYVTPDLFFSREKSPAMDEQALAFSREWYKSIDDSIMTFHGVSIGEVLEYDFYFLFIDALRSVEIARGLLRDSFDAIFVPSMVSREIGHAACYNTLPSILAHIAGEKGTRVVRLERTSQVVAKITHCLNRNMQRFGLGTLNDIVLAFLAVFLPGNFRTLAGLFLHRDFARYALAFPDDGILDNLRDANGLGFRIYPFSLHTPASLSQANRILRYMARDKKNTSRFDVSIVYDGIPLWRVLSPQINQILSELVPSITGRIQWTELFLKMFRPASLAASVDITPLSRSMCQVLKLRRIPVIVVQHGILSNDLAGFYVMPKVGDFQAVWGQYYMKWHVDRGKPAETQVVTGFPRHDRLQNLSPIDRESVCNRFGLNPELRIVLVATEWFQACSSRYTVEEEESYIRYVLRSLKVYDDIQVVVKLHPDYQGKYNKIVSKIAEQEEVRVVIARDSLWDLIRLSSFVIVSVSSVCVEALILGKSVISVSLGDCRDITGLVQDGLAIGAHNESEVKRSIGTCMTVAGRGPDHYDDKRALLLPFTYLADGCASRRVAELIRAKSLRNPERP